MTRREQFENPSTSREDNPMTTMIPALGLLVMISLPLIFRVLGHQKTTVPDLHPRHATLSGDDGPTLLVPEPRPTDEDRTAAPDDTWPIAWPVSFDCTGCHGESSVLRMDQTAIVQVPTGYALVGVCRTRRLHADGRMAPCGRALISATVDASVAAEFIHQGAKPEHSRMVVFRAELGNRDLVNKMTRQTP